MKVIISLPTQTLLHRALSISAVALLLKMAHNDWEIFTTQMNAIFHCILDFSLKEGRSLPSMFSPVPYIQLDSDKVSES